MKNFCILTLVIVTLITTTTGCSLFQPNQISVEPTENTISLLISTEDSLKYCNGADMDSEGFRKTITQKETATIPETNISPEQLANKMLVLAAQKADITFPQSNENPLNYIKIRNQIAYIEPTEGWAGVSIFLCFWKPFVEVNLLQLPEIKKVEWVNSNDEWNNLSQ